MFVSKTIAITLLTIGASALVTPSYGRAAYMPACAITVTPVPQDAALLTEDNPEDFWIVPEAELFQGIPAEDILPQGSEDPDAFLDMPMSAAQLEPYEAFLSASRSKCLVSCDRQYDNVLIPQCRRIRTSRGRAICYGSAATQYSICRARCPRR